MKTLAITAIALALICTASGADQWLDVDVESLIENAPEREDYPDASGVYLHIQKIADVAEDGTVNRARNSLLKILTLRGRERYSNRVFTYNSDVEELTIQKAVTIRKGGKVHEVEKDGINDVTPPFLEDATIYANVLNRVISFPVAGSGSTTELQLLETRSAEKDKSFSGIEYFAGQDPILTKEFRLRVPAGVEVRSELLSGAVGSEVSETEFANEYVWLAENLEGIVPEDNMPPWPEVLPRVIYSSYDGWQGPARFFAGEFYPHVETGGDVAARVQEVTSSAGSSEDRIRAIFLDVAENMRNIDLDLGLGGYEPNDADVVLTNRYGDTRDKAVLLMSMLRAAGIDAYPALVGSRRGTFVESVPTLQQFDRILVAIPEGRGYRFMDPFMDEASYGYLRWGRGNTALIVRDDGTGELANLDAYDPDENLAEKSITLTVAEDGSAEIKAESRVTGYFDFRARRSLQDATPTEEEQAFDNSANVVSEGATSVAYSHSDLKDLTEPVWIRQEIDARDFAVPQGDMMIVRVPPFPFESASTGVYPALAERKLPFEMPCESKSVYTVSTTVPPDYEVARLPEDLALETDIADLGLSCTWDESERTILWEQTAVMKKTTVPVESYEEFKRNVDALISPKNGLVLLRREG